MEIIPSNSNFFAALETSLSRHYIAKLYGKIGWQVRKCAFDEYEIACDWADLTIEAHSPVLMHGAITDIVSRVEEVLAPLRAADIKFTAECYGPEPNRDLFMKVSE